MRSGARAQRGSVGAGRVRGGRSAVVTAHAPAYVAIGRLALGTSRSMRLGHGGHRWHRWHSLATVHGRRGKVAHRHCARHLHRHVGRQRCGSVCGRRSCSSSSLCTLFTSNDTHEAARMTSRSTHWVAHVGRRTVDRASSASAICKRFAVCRVHKTSSKVRVLGKSARKSREIASSSATHHRSGDRASL